MTAAGQPPARGSGQHAVIVGVESRVQRRRLDPTAWVVLEELLLDATITGGSATSAVSVRSIAASLSLSKDTVAAALRRLTKAGLVSGGGP